MYKKIIFIVIVGIGLFLRLYQVTHLPAGLFMDEVAIGVDAKTLAQHGTDQFGVLHPFFFENLTDYKMPVYIYLTALAYKVFGSQIITVRIVAILAGLGLLITIPYLSKLLFPDKKSLPYFAAVVLLLSPFAVHVSRIGYETTVATFFLSLFLIGYVHVLNKNRVMLWWIIGGLAAVLSTWTYPVHRLVVPGFLVVMFLVGVVSQFTHLKKKRMCLVTAGFLGIVLLGAVPLLLSSTANKRALGYIGHGTILQTVGSILSSWLRLWNLEFLFDKGDLFAYRHGTKENGIFLAVFILPYLLGLWYLFTNFTRRHFGIIFLILFSLVAGLPSALTSGVPYATRIVPMLIPYCILIGLGIHACIQLLSKKNGMIRNSIYALAGIILIYQTALFGHIYFVHFKETSLPEFPSAPVELASYLTTYMKEHPATPIYFLQDRTCYAWGHDELQAWYFMDLPSDQMIKWSREYRDRRIAYFKSHPDTPTINVYDKPLMPTTQIGQLVFFPGDKPAPAHSLHVSCGYNLPGIDTKKQTIDKVFYMYEDIHQEPYYVVTEDK